MKNIINLFSTIPDNAKSVLFFGDLRNCFGNIDSNLVNNYAELISIKRHCIDNNGILHIIVLSDDDFDYMNNIIIKVADIFGQDANGYDKTKIKKLTKNIKVWKYSKSFDADDIFNFIKINCSKNLSYDYIIHLGSFHLSFLEKALDLIKNNGGKMTIIEPATWLINVRKNGKAKKYDELKKKLKGHVSKVVIENMNKEIGTGLYVPFAITYIDMDKTFDVIEFICCGEKKEVKSLYECNLIGDYKTIWSILNKCISYKDMMKTHIYNKKKISTHYAAYRGIVGHGGVSDNHERYNWNSQYFGKYNLFQFHAYLQAISIKEDISERPIPIIKAWPAENETPIYKEHTIGNNVSDTYDHLCNWKFNVLNTKLLPFICLCTSFDQHNESTIYLPWLVAKQYTDEEINKLFNFSPEEIELIDKTIKKFERHSPWFKRYMCGKDSVSDEEVQKFIDSL